MSKEIEVNSSPSKSVPSIPGHIEESGDKEVISVCLDPNWKQWDLWAQSNVNTYGSEVYVHHLN